MNQAVLIDLFRNAVLTIIMVAAPMLGIALLIGFIVAVFQATTQINEQTMVFVPKIVGVLFMFILLGPWMLRKLYEFTLALFEGILSLI